MKAFSLLPLLILVGCSQPENPSIFDYQERMAQRFNDEGYRTARLAIENEFDSKISTLDFKDNPETKTLTYKMAYQDNICTVQMDYRERGSTRISVKSLDCIEEKDPKSKILDKYLTESGKKAYEKQLLRVKKSQVEQATEQP